MKNKIITNNIVAFIHVGEPFLEFKEFCKNNNLKLSQEFSPVSCNSFVKMMYSPNIKEFAEHCNYEIIKVPLTHSLDFKNNGLKTLLNYYNQ